MRLQAVDAVQDAPYLMRLGGRECAQAVDQAALVHELLDDVDKARRVRPDVELASGGPLRRHGEKAKGARKRRGAKT